MRNVDSLLRHFTLSELRDWNALRQSLATGQGVRRNPRIPHDLSKVPPTRDHLGRRLLELAVLDTERGGTVTAHGDVFARLGFVRVWVPDSPVHAYVVDMSHYRTLQRARQRIEDGAARRAFPGWRPALAGLGPDRFRPFDPIPAVERIPEWLRLNSQGGSGVGLHYVSR